MEDNETIFTDAPGITELVEHEIKLTTSQQIRVKQYHIPFSQARVVCVCIIYSDNNEGTIGYKNSNTNIIKNKNGLTD